ncbi:MAG: hypothetical protein H7255_11935, partial [Ramlibacter sp.]|nr:hypothetical protein [Ramlibacter sp.]
MALIQGDNDANSLTGTAGDDTISGLGGNDTITGGGGNDSIDFGNGIDTGVLSGTMGQYQFAMTVNAYSWKFEPFYQAHWTLNTFDSIGARNGHDMMSDVEYLQFARGTVRWHDVPVTYTVSLQTSVLDNVVIAGGTMNDTMTGHDGADLFVGGLGNDVIDGKGGDDTVAYTSFNTYVTMLPLEGGVTVNVQAGSATGTWGNDTLINIEHVIGTMYPDLIIGNAEPNNFFGIDGNDTMFGGAGPDSLDGGNGVDWALYEGNSADYTIRV